MPRTTRGIPFYCRCVYCEEYFEVGGAHGSARWFCEPSHGDAFNRHGGKERRKVMGKCLICGDLLNRTNQKYCSAACRQRAYRNRKGL